MIFGRRLRFFFKVPKVPVVRLGGWDRTKDLSIQKHQADGDWPRFSLVDALAKCALPSRDEIIKLFVGDLHDPILMGRWKSRTASPGAPEGQSKEARAHSPKRANSNVL